MIRRREENGVISYYRRRLRKTGEITGISQSRQDGLRRGKVGQGRAVKVTRPEFRAPAADVSENDTGAVDGGRAAGIWAEITADWIHHLVVQYLGERDLRIRC